MRLFRCDEKVGRKSIISNQSIVPCSEEDSFVESGVNRQGGSISSGTVQPPNNISGSQLHAGAAGAGSSTFGADQIVMMSNDNLAQYNAARRAMNGAKHGAAASCVDGNAQENGARLREYGIVGDR